MKNETLSRTPNTKYALWPKGGGKSINCICPKYQVVSIGLSQLKMVKCELRLFCHQVLCVYLFLQTGIHIEMAWQLV